MKRTLTAAAVLASSAGALGFAGTATAAGAPEFPAELPVDNGLANTAFHAAGTLHSATRVVGDVVPAPEQRSNERSARVNPVNSLRDPGKESKPDESDNSDSEEQESKPDESDSSDVGGQETPPGKPGGVGHGAGQPGQAAKPGKPSITVNGKPAKLLPLDGTVLADLPNTVNKLPGLGGENLPTELLPGKATPPKVLPTAKAGGLPVGGFPQLDQEKPASLVDRLGEVVGHGLLGGATNLSGS